MIFEATVINTLVEYWGYNQSPAILITVSLILYLGINVYRADLFGEVECESTLLLHTSFMQADGVPSGSVWLALGKVLLATGLILYTFITMVGGNPLHE